MAEPVPKVRRIFHPTDYSPPSEAAFAHALRLALAAGSELHVMHVESSPDEDGDWTDFPGVRSTLVRWGIAPPGAGEAGLEQARVRIRKVRAIDDDPASALAEYVERHHADLIVLSTHQRQGLSRWVHHDTAERLARGSHTMTLFVPRPSEGFVAKATGQVSLGRVVIPVAHQPSAQQAIDRAGQIASLLDCERVVFTLLHVGTPEDFPPLDLPTTAGWSWERATLAGDLLPTLLAAIDEFHPDLVALTTEGHHSLVDMLRGSTAEQLLRQVSCPLLAVPCTPARSRV